MILTEASLSFLDLGVPRPIPRMLSLPGPDHKYRATWQATALSLAVFGFNILGDALRGSARPAPERAVSGSG